MKILIDNGHGRATAGKRSPVWPDGKQLFEYEFNRDIARRMHEALTARGTDSVPVVPEIDDIPLAERTRRVNEIRRTGRPGKLSARLDSCQRRRRHGMGSVDIRRRNGSG